MKKKKNVLNLQHSNGDKQQKLKLWHNSKNLNVTKLKMWREKNQKLKIWQLKLWQNWKTQIMTKLQK